MDPMATSPKRTFIGWTKPILQRATERLFDEHARDGRWDLRQWLIVLPSSQAKRRLEELLALKADQTQVLLYPPEIVTVGHLPEHLYVAQFPFAGEMLQILAWCKALQESDPRQLENVLPLPPKNGFSQQWLELGKMLSGVHRELASDGLNFEGVIEVLGSHPEAKRWKALSEVQKRYLRVLDSQKLWDIQTARLVALQHNEPRTDQQILMLGTVDLNRTQRGFLAAVAEHVHIWIAAPQDMSDHFDEFGCVVGPAWEDTILELPAECLLVGNSPRDQFELTAAALAELDDTTHARDITLGVPDQTLIPLLEQHLGTTGTEVRFGPGTPLAQSEPAQLLELIGAYLSNRNYVDLAALLRHPVVTQMVRHQMPELGASWLAEIDQYYDAVLPRVVDEWINETAKGAGTYARVTQAIDAWLQPLISESRAIDAWADPLLQLMQQAYVEQECLVHDECNERLTWACRMIAAEIISLRDVPQELALTLTAAEAIDWLMHSMAGTLVPRSATRTAIEMFGWLDLPLDDAGTLIITGIHDGVVPECVNADPFLPNQLRRQLGMMDNQRRYARDMYAFQVLLHSRKHVRVIVGRANLAGDPLVPSRLLLACDLADLPARVLRLTSEEHIDVLPEVQKRWTNSASPRPAFALPQPDSTRKPPYVTVTAFRTYLACPYRYYLKHVCGLKTIDDLNSELDAGQFGDLIHATLECMHKDPIGQSDNAEAIEIFLKNTLETVAREKYGPKPAAAIRVQLANAQDRLAVFARLQADHVAEGWVTRHWEAQAIIKKGALFAGEKLPIQLLGRIDRIDHHPATGRWAIWDYKTSDSGTRPVQNHLTLPSTWIDLQLPLYRHLGRALGIDSEPTVGYILLPKSLKEIGFIEAKFTETQLASADKEALRILHAIAAGRYEPISTSPIDYDDFERICMVGTQQVAPPPPMRRIQDQRRASGSMQKVTSSVTKTANKRLADPEYSTQRLAQAKSLPPLMIRASAGTGKTYQLSNRLLEIILSGQSVDHILATTFTRKAAGEILQRVLGRLAKACLNDEEFARLHGALPELSFDQADCLAALRKVTRQLHRFRVSTLDSFYAQVARTFSLELHLAPGWSAIDPVREAAVRMQAIQRMLDQSDQRTLTSLVKMLAKGDTKRSVAAEIEDTVLGGYAYYRAANEDAFKNLVVPASPRNMSIARPSIVCERTIQATRVFATLRCKWPTWR